jgi:hypothetical protein
MGSNSPSPKSIREELRGAWEDVFLILPAAKKNRRKER